MTLDVTPDRLGALRGFRCWNLYDGELRSKGNKFAWRPGENVARCSVNHAVPTRDCRCGLYAYKDQASLAHVLWNDDSSREIMGEIDLWGRIIEYEEGYRAEQAEITAIYADPNLDRRAAARVAKEFNVPLVEVALIRPPQPDTEQNRAVRFNRYYAWHQRPRRCAWCATELVYGDDYYSNGPNFRCKPCGQNQQLVEHLLSEKTVEQVVAIGINVKYGNVILTERNVRKILETWGSRR